LLLDGKRFAGESRLVDQEVRRREHAAIGRHEITRGQDDDVAGTMALAGTLCSLPSRSTRQVSAKRRFSSLIAVEARYSR
jgi:hypothetical protein